MKKSLISFLLALTCLPCCHALSIYPGGVVEFIEPKFSDELPTVRYGLKEPVIIDQDESWRILVGVGLDTFPGEYVIYFDSSGSDTPARNIKFVVMPAAKRPLQKQLTPFQIDGNAFIADIDGDASLNGDASLSDLDYQNTQQPDLPLDYPVAGQWQHSFGTVANADSDKPARLNYIELFTTELLPVTSPQNAIVSRIKTHQNGVISVYLDHGRGLYSIISGLSDLNVAVGDGINRGALIGKLPLTQSNITPARIIWQCVLNGAYVDPLILTQL